MREISYEEQTVKSGNPLARFAHRTRMTMAIDLVTNLCATSGTVVDFGAGPGLFLHTLGETRRDVTLVGHDPYMAPAFPEVRYAESLDTVATQSVDVLTALEVCEHLYRNELDALLDDAARILKPKGALVISVPIMYGLAIAPKVSNWMIRSRSFKSEYSPAELLKSMVGIPVCRPQNPRTTHKGFDFRELREIVSEQFFIDAVHLSPVPHTHWWLSSQYFMICRPRARV
ncbi:Methyltransferase domain protein [Caballeronia arationis]|jgi:2-polyprenyl-3-methyl-5-hydroxy-6-metoxy-1,4-benzoquinol methylase|uniref:Methyltransferase domain-containing protein n=2 Tax=Caballeronia arationis TaxID=1777142 RepID=A0A7Z7IGI6_9BURK|nr:Methyltransferase domain protein [Caballeronia arationis]SOE88862.1 Methyltransferase domain-containing protein [Caballeronia arationis]